MSNVFWGAPEAMAENANPFALLLGDSWFWYPLDNLAVEIAAAGVPISFPLDAIP